MPLQNQMVSLPLMLLLLLLLLSSMTMPPRAS